MTEEIKLSANQKIARLRSMFINELPKRLELIDELWFRLKTDNNNMDALTELHRTVHSLRGTGRSFGFNQLGEAIDNAEHLLSNRLKNPEAALSPDWIQKMDGFMAELAQDVGFILSVDSEVGSLQDLQDIESYKPFWPSHNCRGKTIYVCDDDPLVLEQISTQLSCFGYQTVAFTELEKLNRSVLENRPDAIIVDINFPEGRYAGTDMVGSMRKELGYQLPVLFLSSRDDFDARLSAVLAGGTDYFTKPANIQELVASLDNLTCQSAQEPYRILVVDDETTVSDYHSVILQEAGMITRCINEPSRILGILQEFRPDLVLLDMYMPVCTGLDLARLIRQVHEYAAIPIIYLSSETDKEKQFSAMRIGAEGFMTKPVVPAELVAAVEIRAERMRVLRSMMVRDSLTGLFNHTTTTQLLEASICSTRRNGSHLCFVMIDIDHFKKVNDSYGHPTGDQVILALARALRQRLRISDFVGRYGGEEFALILQDVDITNAKELVEGLRQDFERLSFNGQGTSFSCTFSAGIADFPRFGTLEKLREAADQALYRAKHEGRNLVVVA